MGCALAIVGLALWFVPSSVTIPLSVLGFILLLLGWALYEDNR